MKNTLLLLSIILLFANCQSEQNAVSKYPAHVGDIIFSKKLDGADFKRCLDEKFTFQYYNDSKGFQFKGEKIRIERKLEALHLKSDENSNGYITIRFVVNCEGKAGQFRIQEMNENYQEISFTKKFTSQL